MTEAGAGARRWWPWAIFAAAVAVRLIAFAIAEVRNPTSLMAPDTSQHVELARTLLQEGRFAEEPGGPAHTRVMPGFATLIAAVYAAFGETPRGVVLVGVVLSALTVVVAALAAARLGGPEAGLVSGLFLVFDTASVGACLRMLTEAPFTFLLTGAVAMALSGALGAPPRPGRAALLGALLSAAALTRPVALFLAFPVAAWLLLCARAQGWSRRTAVAMVGAFTLPWLVMVGSWQVRNRVEAGTYAASGGPAKFLLLSRGGDIVAQRDGVPFQEARAELSRGIAEEASRTGAREESLYLRPALELIARHPLLFLRTQVRWLPELLVGTGAAPLAGRMGLDVPGNRRLALARAGLRLASIVHLLMLYAAFVWALWTARAQTPERRLALVLFAGVALYFVLLSTGPQGYSRLRAPIMPLLAMGAGLGVAEWRRRMGQAT
jgi:4-amino-4-deoxy-L-arabinose transferase-like glycosyltransferase